MNASREAGHPRNDADRPGPLPAASTREQLSLLADGELPVSDVARVCAAWREDAEMRDTWHAYQLIGDALRSQDLVSAAQRDERLLQAVRARLAAEPVVMAPAPLARGPRRPVRWQRPFAVAAGFAAVAGVSLVLRTSDPGAGTATLAGQPVSGDVIPVAATASPKAPAIANPSERLVRDAQLDAYLAAHRPFSLGGGLGVPAGAVRHAQLIAPDR